MRNASILWGLSLWFLPCLAGTGTPLVVGWQHTLESRVMNETRDISVLVPPGYGDTDVRYPVLYLTDGRAHLWHSGGTLQFLAANGVIPQMIVVAVTNTDRTRDLSPTESHADFLREGQETGGADRFLKFFETELFPFIENNYRTQPYRIFGGHSFGGTFAVHCLLAHPELFDAYISVSPNLQWDDGVLVKRARKALKKGSLKGKTLFITLGNEQAPMKTFFEDFIELLEKHPVEGFEWKHQVFPEETHGSVVLRSHYFAFKMIFDGWALGPDVDSLAELKTHADQWSKRLGYPYDLPEILVNLLGYQVLQAGQPEQAVEIFTYNSENYPDSPNVYDSLGDGLFAAERYQEARESYQKAVKLGTQQNHAFLATFKANLEKAENKVK